MLFRNSDFFRKKWLEELKGRSGQGFERGFTRYKACVDVDRKNK